MRTGKEPNPSAKLRPSLGNMIRNGGMMLVIFTFIGKIMRIELEKLGNDVRIANNIKSFLLHSQNQL